MRRSIQCVLLCITVVSAFGGAKTCSSDTELELVKIIDVPKALAKAGFQAQGSQGIHIFPEKPNKVYTTTVEGFGVLETDLKTAEVKYLATAESPTTMYLPDDVTGIPGETTAYVTSLVTANLTTLVAGQGFCNNCAGAILKLETEGENAGKVEKLWSGVPGIDMLINPIAYADGHFYTGTSLAIKTASMGMTFDGKFKTDADMDYPRKIYKIEAKTGKLVWEKTYDFHVNAFDVRDGWIYAGTSTAGGALDTVMTYQGGNFRIVRISTENGKVETVIDSDVIPQNAYILNVKFAGDRMFFCTDRIWAADYNTVTKKVDADSLRLAYDFGTLEPEIRVRTLSERFNQGTNYKGPKITILDNAIPHPDGQHYVVSADKFTFVFKMKPRQAHSIQTLP